MDYLNEMRPVIERLARNPKSLEIDPTRLGKGETIAQNLQNLERAVTETFDVITKSREKIPAVVRVRSLTISTLVSAELFLTPNASPYHSTNPNS